MISLDQIKKIYPNTGAGLDQISTQFARSEWVTLLGPSGCGKTTLLRLIAGLEKPSAGVIENTFTAAETSFVFQEAALLPWKTVIDNITLPLTLAGIKPKQAREKAMHWIHKLKLNRFENVYPRTLSGGMKMRVSLARALITEPKLLLMDEPFAALDEPIRIELGQEMRALFLEKKLTVIMVTHSITEGLWLADRVLVMKDQPGIIVRDEKLKFEDQRDLSVRARPEFQKEVTQAFEILKSSSSERGA